MHETKRQRFANKNVEQSQQLLDEDGGGLRCFRRVEPRLDFYGILEGSIRPELDFPEEGSLSPRQREAAGQQGTEAGRSRKGGKRGAQFFANLEGGAAFNVRGRARALFLLDQTLG